MIRTAFFDDKTYICVYVCNCLMLKFTCLREASKPHRNASSLGLYPCIIHRLHQRSCDRGRSQCHWIQPQSRSPCAFVKIQREYHPEDGDLAINKLRNSTSEASKKNRGSCFNYPKLGILHGWINPWIDPTLYQVRSHPLHDLGITWTEKQEEHIEKKTGGKNSEIDLVYIWYKDWTAKSFLVPSKKNKLGWVQSPSLTGHESANGGMDLDLMIKGPMIVM